VQEVLDEMRPVRESAYTTVLTVVDNLFKKSWLRREPAERAFRHTPVLSQQEYGARLMRASLDGSGDAERALVAFVGQMSPAETAVLRAALDAHEPGPEGAEASRWSGCICWYWPGW
jgi:predicted transcriptional regulator